MQTKQLSAFAGPAHLHCLQCGISMVFFAFIEGSRYIRVFEPSRGLQCEHGPAILTETFQMIQFEDHEEMEAWLKSN